MKTRLRMDGIVAKGAGGDVGDGLGRGKLAPEPARGCSGLSPAEKMRLDGQLLEAVGKGDAAKVGRLLDAGADVDAKNERGWTALMEAADKEDVEAARMLIERGADVNARNISLWTALMSACHRHNVELVRMLVGAGADVNAKDDAGQDALMGVIASPCRPKPTTVIAPIVMILVDAGANVNAGRNDFGFTALGYARSREKSGNPEIAEILIAAGATE